VYGCLNSLQGPGIGICTNALSHAAVSNGCPCISSWCHGAVTVIHHAERETVNDYLGECTHTHTHTHRGFVTWHTRKLEYVPCNDVQAVLPSRHDEVRAPTETNMRTNEYAVTEIPRLTLELDS